ncbi:MAG: NAD-binding protein [Bacteroidota bacterium]|nr:NAD-binding protein [Bacteroidota bacterium]MDP4225213.1 NAD-binding protein [Bacteroidota bacterium]
MKRENLKPIYFSLALLFLVINIGVFGFMLIEHYNLTEAFFMTIITLATVGFNEVRPLSPHGMWFTSILIIFSIGIFAVTVTTVTRYIVEGVFGNYYKLNKVKSKIEKLKGHVIVCGYGRNGKQAVNELLTRNEPMVIIEKNEEILEGLQNDPQLLFIKGDATNDEILHAANIENAKSLLTTLPVDADNLYVVLSAREINSKLQIISRASHDGSDKKLRWAGADNVIMPDKIGGQRMAKLVSQPDVVEFMEYVMMQSTNDVTIEEISFEKYDRHFEGMTIEKLHRLCSHTGINILGLRLGLDQSFCINPRPETFLHSNDKLFVLGTLSQVSQFIKMLEDL